MLPHLGAFLEKDAVSLGLVAAAGEEHHHQSKQVWEHQHKLIGNIDAKGL